MEIPENNGSDWQAGDSRVDPIGNITDKDVKPPDVDGAERHRFELASPYGPDATPDNPDREFAPEILHALRDSWEQLRAENPDYYIGLTVWGSAVKGRMHEETNKFDHSDVDVTVFLSDAAEPYWSDILGAEVKEFSQINSVLDALMQQQLGVGIPEELVQASFRSISEERLQEEVDYLVEALKVPRGLSELEAELDEEDILERGKIVVPDVIRDLFAVQVGSGEIRNMRQYLLDVIGAQPEAEKIWTMIRGGVVAKEEHNRKAKIYFPDNLESAQKMYGTRQAE